MDDSLLYTGHGPVQSKSMQYINTQPFSFNVQPIQMPNMPDLTGILGQQEEPEQADKLSDFDKLMKRQFLMSSLTDNQPIQTKTVDSTIQPESQVKQASDITELPNDGSIDPWSFTYHGYNFDKLMKHEQGYDRKTGRMIAPLKSYYNGSGVNRIRLWGPGITSNTWKSYNLANGSNITLDQIDQMSDQDRFNLFKKFGSWYVDNLEKAYGQYGIGNLSPDLKKSILDASWEYGVYSPMVKNMIYLMTGNAIKGMNPNITWDMMTDPGYVGKFFPKYPFEVKPAVGRMKEARKYYEASRGV